MKPLFVVVLAISFSGCAHTTLYFGGRPIMRTQADATNITYQGNGVSFHADTLVHSTPTIAGGQSTRNIINGVTAGVTATGVAVATSGVIR